MLHQRTGKGALFFQVMFGLLLIAAARSFLLKSHWLDRLPPLMLGLIGLGSLIAVTLLRRDVVVAVTLEAQALRLRRRSGAEEPLPLSRLIGIRRDIGQDLELAYLLVFQDDRLLRLRPPQRGARAPLQQFVEWTAQRAGLTWDGPNAAPPPGDPSPPPPNS
ncbi:MAG TPA: hypothetical protein VK013_09125 [Myxococcaceae bacterium]|nr:hypothetical protein [Myxococcaceae bacterium]